MHRMTSLGEKYRSIRLRCDDWFLSRCYRTIAHAREKSSCFLVVPPAAVVLSENEGIYAEGHEAQGAASQVMMKQSPRIELS